MKIEYYDKLNWGSILFDLGILGLVALMNNPWLIPIVFLSGGYKIPKYEYKD